VDSWRVTQCPTALDFADLEWLSPGAALSLRSIPAKRRGSEAHGGR
jgi:hypothetical protein